MRLENINLTTEINAKLKEIAEDVLAQRVELAELRGDKDALLVLLKQVVARARKQVRDAIKAKGDVLAERIKLRTAIGDVREVEQEAADELFGVLEQRIQLAESRGHKNEALRIIDRAIADRKREINRLKGLGRATLGVQQQIEDLIDKREEIKETAEKADKGTTAFDLLTQFTERFNQSAGSLVGPDQPFISAQDFTSDISKFLVRKPSTGASISAPPTPGGKTKFDLNDDRIVRSMDRLADAIERSSMGGGGRNVSTATGRPERESGGPDLRYSSDARSVGGV